MVPISSAADFHGFAALRTAALADDPAAADEVAVQFEALVIGQLLKSARDSSLHSELFNGPGTRHYYDLFDQQVALNVARKGGFGFAEAITQHFNDNPPETAASWRPASRDEFVQAIWGHATGAAAALGLEPELVVAHAALETGWGSAMPELPDGAPSFNLFGIKAGADWHGKRVGRTTLEFEAGIAWQRKEPFRVYESLDSAFADYVKLLRGPRYAEARGHAGDAKRFAVGLKAGGYATDPDYVNKLTKLSASSQLASALAPLKSPGLAPTQAGN